MPRLHVAVGVIRDHAGNILISKRHRNSHQGGLWEFPGGKVEPGESVQSALRRELHEELGITVESTEALIRIEHDYSDKQVLLDVWWVTGFSGLEQGLEGQPLRWVSPQQLADFEFPAANVPIVTAVLDAQLRSGGA